MAFDKLLAESTLPVVGLERRTPGNQAVQTQLLTKGGRVLRSFDQNLHNFPAQPPAAKVVCPSKHSVPSPMHFDDLLLASLAIRNGTSLHVCEPVQTPQCPVNHTYRIGMPLLNAV